MSNCARYNDVCGGRIVTTANSVFVNGLPIARLNDRVTPHGKGGHGRARIVSASSTVFANGLPVARLGDRASCGHRITTASPNVFVG